MTYSIPPKSCTRPMSSFTRFSLLWLRRLSWDKRVHSIDWLNWRKVVQSCPTLCDPMGYTVHGILPVRILEWVAFPFSRDLPNPGIEPRSPALQADSLPAEPQGKPKNTGVGSLSLFQRIFLTQESNQGLLYCRQILYQLSYQGSPGKTIGKVNLWHIPKCTHY